MKRIVSLLTVLPILAVTFVPNSRTIPPASAAIAVCPGAAFALTGSQEVPPVVTSASASATIGYNITSHTISWKIIYSDLTGSATGAHIHSGLPGVDGPIEVNIGGISGLSSPMIGSAVLTAGQETDLLEGKLYINIHSTIFSGGEVRGQIPVPTYPLSGAQQVPPTASTADGSAILFFDIATSTLSWSVSFSGLQGALIGAHFHNAAAGVNGPIVIDIGAISGLNNPMVGSITLTPIQVVALKTSNLYVNLHSTIFPGGEIRGQIDGCSMPNVLHLPIVLN